VTQSTPLWGPSSQLNESDKCQQVEEEAHQTNLNLLGRIVGESLEPFVLGEKGMGWTSVCCQRQFEIHLHLH